VVSFTLLPSDVQFELDLAAAMRPVVDRTFTLDGSSGAPRRDTGCKRGSILLRVSSRATA
jgi:hypothetical protein